MQAIVAKPQLNVYLFIFFFFLLTRELIEVQVYSPFNTLPYAVNAIINSFSYFIISDFMKIIRKRKMVINVQSDSYSRENCKKKERKLIVSRIFVPLFFVLTKKFLFFYTILK